MNSNNNNNYNQSSVVYSSDSASSFEEQQPYVSDSNAYEVTSPNPSEDTTNPVGEVSNQEVAPSTEHSYEPQVWEQPCENCGAVDTFTEDHRAGDWVCTACGNVVQSRLISHEAEYRIFSDDSESKSKIRIGAAYNPLSMDYSLTERNRLERDEKEFLWDGLKNIDEIFFKLYKGDSVNTSAQHRAKELFQQAFRLQVEQKKGVVPMKRSSGDKAKNKLNRQKFSRRKQFVIACLHRALKESHIDTWDIPALSDLLDGIQVSKYSVKNCLKDLNLEAEQAAVHSV
jgi:hypothetical protein